jgi:hypothetical protein
MRQILFVRAVGDADSIDLGAAECHCCNVAVFWFYPKDHT